MVTKKSRSSDPSTKKLKPQDKNSQLSKPLSIKTPREIFDFLLIRKENWGGQHTDGLIAPGRFKPSAFQVFVTLAAHYTDLAIGSCGTLGPY